MVIFLKGELETLNYFIDCMSEGTENTHVLNVTEPVFGTRLLELEPYIDETTCVVTFNNSGVMISFTEGECFWEKKKVKLYNIYVDSPVWFDDALNINLKCMQIITVDKYHEQFVKDYYPDCSSVHFLPHGGMKLAQEDEIPYEERSIDVLYVGSRQNMKPLEDFSLISDMGKEILGVMRRTLIEHPYLTPERLLEICLNNTEGEISREEMLEVFKSIYIIVLSYVRGYYQGRVIERLAEAKVHVDLYSGEGWRDIAEKYPEYIHLHEDISPEECIKQMKNSKVTLNIMPWFKYGAHERIYNAMLNGSVCVSDTSEYLQKHFKNGQNIILYELNKLDSLVKNVQVMLDAPEFAKHIIDNQKKTVARSTWRDRLDNILGQKFEEGKDFI